MKEKIETLNDMAREEGEDGDDDDNDNDHDNEEEEVKINASDAAAAGKEEKEEEEEEENLPLVGTVKYTPAGAAKEQTAPPTVPVTELFPNGFPEGEIQEYQDNNGKTSWRLDSRRRGSWRDWSWTCTITRGNALKYTEK